MKALLAGIALALASTGTAAASPAGMAPAGADGLRARVWVTTATGPSNCTSGRR